MYSVYNEISCKAFLIFHKAAKVAKIKYFAARPKQQECENLTLVP